jgi:hypothetical protein
MERDKAIIALHFALEDALEAGMSHEDIEMEVAAFLETSDEDESDEPVPTLSIEVQQKDGDVIVFQPGKAK